MVWLDFFVGDPVIKISTEIFYILHIILILHIQKVPFNIQENTQNIKHLTFIVIGVNKTNNHLVTAAAPTNEIGSGCLMSSGSQKVQKETHYDGVVLLRAYPFSCVCLQCDLISSLLFFVDFIHLRDGDRSL